MREYLADVMARGIWKIATLAAIAAAMCAAPARAGTYDVTTCSPSGPGGVNHAWTYAVRRLDDKALYDTEADGYLHDSACTDPLGLSIRSNYNATRDTWWGTWAAWEFSAPANTTIVGLKLWRYSRVMQTAANGDNAGRWETLIHQDLLTRGGGEVGGTYGPDQCKPGFAGYPNPCSHGARGFGSDAFVSYQLATPVLSLGIFCGTDAGTLQWCHPKASDGGPAGEFAMRAAVITIRDDVAPTVQASGALLDSGWRLGNETITYNGSDNAGIRSAQLLLDGQARAGKDFSCDYTYPTPCSNVSGQSLSLGSAPLTDGTHQLQLVLTDAAGNTATFTKTISIDAHGPVAVLKRAAGKAITVSVGDGSGSGVKLGGIEVRNNATEPFRALPTRLIAGRLSATLDRGNASRVGIRISVTDNVGNTTAGQLSELALRVHGRSLHGGSTSVAYGHAATFSGRLTTRDGVPLAGQPVTIQQTAPAAANLGTVATDTNGHFIWKAPAGTSRRLVFALPGGPDLLPLSRVARIGVRAFSTIHASRRLLHGRGTVRFSGRLGLIGATVPHSGKLVDLQAFDRGRWRTFATARARGSKGTWHSSYTFGGIPGRYPIRVRIRHEAVFPYDLGYSKSVVVRVR